MWTKGTRVLTQGSLGLKDVESTAIPPMSCAESSNKLPGTTAELMLKAQKGSTNRSLWCIVIVAAVACFVSDFLDLWVRTKVMSSEGERHMFVKTRLTQSWNLQNKARRIKKLGEYQEIPRSPKSFFVPSPSLVPATDCHCGAGPILPSNHHAARVWSTSQSWTSDTEPTSWWIACYPR